MGNNYVIPNYPVYDLVDKERNYQLFVADTLNRLIYMFKWNNLPETLAPHGFELERQLLTHGHVGVFKKGDEIHGLWGNFAGKPNEFYDASQYIITNPILEVSKTFTIDKDIVVMRNDSLAQGVLPIVGRASKFMVESDITMTMNLVNARAQWLLSADDDATKQGCDQFIKNLIDGKLSSIASDDFNEGLKVSPMATSASAGTLTDLIEAQNYYFAKMWNNLGLDSNFNLKREAIGQTEVEMNTPTLRTLVDDMLRQRQEAADRINEMFGLDISVELDGPWARSKEIEEIELDNLENPDEVTEDNTQEEEETNDEKTE